MIQRIQSVYLFLVLIIMGSIFFFPYAELLGTNNDVYIFNFNGLSVLNEEGIYFLTTPPIILLSIIVLITLITIFLYKKRIIQMRLSFINILLLLGYIGLNYYYIKSFSSQLEGTISFKITATFPLISAVLTYLAIRAIGKDEALIRSVNRLR